MRCNYDCEITNDDDYGGDDNNNNNNNNNRITRVVNGNYCNLRSLSRLSRRDYNDGIIPRMRDGIALAAVIINALSESGRRMCDKH